MKLMILDGNSIINRAFYGVRLLSTKAVSYTHLDVYKRQVVYVQMREQRVSLEDGVDFSFIGRHVVDALPSKKHIAGRRRQKTTDNS